MRFRAPWVSASIAIAATIGCGREQPATLSFTDRVVPNGWQGVSAELELETGLVVFTRPFSCGLTAEELGRLREISASKSRLAFVLLTSDDDSASVAAAAHDLGFTSYRTMTETRFSALAGVDHGLPLFVLFKRGRPAVIMSDVMSRRLEALEAFF